MNPLDGAGARIARWYETLSPDSLGQLEQYYAADARFVDPFNDLSGTAAIRKVFDHMYASLEQPRFEVLHLLQDGAQVVLVWNFHFRTGRRQRPYCVHGNSYLLLDRNGQVQLHRDYWDPARELYENLPLLGSVLRWLRRQLGTPA